MKIDLFNRYTYRNQPKAGLFISRAGIINMLIAYKDCQT